MVIMNEYERAEGESCEPCTGMCQLHRDFWKMIGKHLFLFILAISAIASWVFLTPNSYFCSI